jgi:hypothetical protein
MTAHSRIRTSRATAEGSVEALAGDEANERED